jgi:hypothetical protein
MGDLSEKSFCVASGASVALRSIAGLFVAPNAKVDFHGLPVVPVAVLHLKDFAAVKTPELAFTKSSERLLRLR